MASNRWVGFSIIFLSSVTIAMNQFKVPPVMAELMQALELDMVAGGTVMSLYALTVTILIYPAAFVLSWIGARNTCLIALGCAVVGPLLGALLPGYSFLLLGRIVEGVGSAFISVAAPTMIAASFQEHEQGKPMGIWASWIPVGVMLIFNLAIPLSGIFGDWRGPWWFCSLANTLFLGLMAVSFPSDRPVRSRDAHSQESQAASQLATGLSIFKNGAVLALALAFFGTGFRELGFATWAPKYFSEIFHINPSTANFLNSISYLATLVGTVIGGAMLDARRSMTMLLTTSSAVMLVAAAFSFSLHADWILPFMFIMGLTGGFIIVSCFTGAARNSTSPAQVPWAIATCTVSCFLGHLTAPILVGAVVERFGWFYGTFVVEIGPMLILVAAFAYTRASRTAAAQRVVSASLSNKV